MLITKQILTLYENNVSQRDGKDEYCHYLKNYPEKL